MKLIQPLDVRQARSIADSTYPHSRDCKKTLDRCSACQATIAWFAGLPLDTLALVLEDKPKERRH